MTFWRVAKCFKVLLKQMYYLARFFSYAEVATDLIQDKLNMEH